MIGKDAAFEELAVYRIEKLTYLPQVMDFGVYKDKQLLEVYNHKQLYPALGYLAPVEFELLHGGPLTRSLTGCLAIGIHVTEGIHVTDMKSKIVGSSIVVAGRDQVSCDLAGEVAILDVKSGIYYGLNAVGVRIWNLVQEPKTVDEVGETIQEEYDVETHCCERDILALLQELVAKGLIEVRNGAAT